MSEDPTHEDERDDEVDDALDAAVADAFARRGELVPITVDEVRAAEDQGAEFEGELPASLARFASPSKGLASSRDDAGPARSERVASLDEARRARAAQRTASTWTHIATFGLGVAVAAGAMLMMRTPERPSPSKEPGAGAPSSSSTAQAATSAKIEIGPVSRCASDCCAGASCGAAQGELRSCASGRACVACGDATAQGDAFRVRVGLFSPTPRFGDREVEKLTWCARVASTDWSCLPFRGEPGASPTSRSFAKLASGADLAAGLEIELRAEGEKKPLGHWRDSVRVGATALCRGVGALVVDDEDQHLGSLALQLDETHYVELARSDDPLGLAARRDAFATSDASLSLFETSASGKDHFALGLGPFDKATAERVRWTLLEHGQSVRVVLGDDYVGEPKPLP